MSSWYEDAQGVWRQVEDDDEKPRLSPSEAKAVWVQDEHGVWHEAVSGSPPGVESAPTVPTSSQVDEAVSPSQPPPQKSPRKAAPAAAAVVAPDDVQCMVCTDDDDSGDDDARELLGREDLCGTFGCTLPDRHGGLHRIPESRRRGASSVAKDNLADCGECRHCVAAVELVAQGKARRACARRRQLEELQRLKGTLGYMGDAPGGGGGDEAAGAAGEADERPDPPTLAPVHVADSHWAYEPEPVLVRVRPPFAQPPRKRPRHEAPAQAATLQGHSMARAMQLCAAVHSWVARSRSGRIDWDAVGASMTPPLPAEPAHRLWRCVAYGAAQRSFLQKRVDGKCGGPAEAALDADAAGPGGFEADLEMGSDVEGYLEEQAEATRIQQQDAKSVAHFLSLPESKRAALERDVWSRPLDDDDDGNEQQQLQQQRQHADATAEVTDNGTEQKAAHSAQPPEANGPLPPVPPRVPGEAPRWDADVVMEPIAGRPAIVTPGRPAHRIATPGWRIVGQKQPVGSTAAVASGLAGGAEANSAHHSMDDQAGAKEKKEKEEEEKEEEGKKIEREQQWLKQDAEESDESEEQWVPPNFKVQPPDERMLVDAPSVGKPATYGCNGEGNPSVDGKEAPNEIDGGSKVTAATSIIAAALLRSYDEGEEEDDEEEEDEDDDDDQDAEQEEQEVQEGSLDEDAEASRDGSSTQGDADDESESEVDEDAGDGEQGEGENQHEERMEQDEVTGPELIDCKLWKGAATAGWQLRCLAGSHYHYTSPSGERFTSIREAKRHAKASRVNSSDGNDVSCAPIMKAPTATTASLSQKRERTTTKGGRGTKRLVGRSWPPTPGVKWPRLPTDRSGPLALEGVEPPGAAPQAKEARVPGWKGICDKDAWCTRGHCHPGLCKLEPPPDATASQYARRGLKPPAAFANGAKRAPGVGPSLAVGARQHIEASIKAQQASIPPRAEQSHAASSYGARNVDGRHHGWSCTCAVCQSIRGPPGARVRTACRGCGTVICPREGKRWCHNHAPGTWQHTLSGTSQSNCLRLLCECDVGTICPRPGEQHERVEEPTLAYRGSGGAHVVKKPLRLSFEAVSTRTSGFYKNR